MHQQTKRYRTRADTGSDFGSSRPAKTKPTSSLVIEERTPDIALCMEAVLHSIAVRQDVPTLHPLLPIIPRYNALHPEVMALLEDESWNWLAVLKDLAAGAPVSEAMTCAMNIRASKWPTCACGQVCGRLPRNENGAPLDRVLGMLGIRFMEVIMESDWNEAIRFFHKIEYRTDILLRPMDHGRR